MQMVEETEDAANEPSLSDVYEEYDVGQFEIHVNDQSAHEASNVIPQFLDVDVATESTGIEIANTEIAQTDPLGGGNLDVVNGPKGNENVLSGHSFENDNTEVGSAGCLECEVGAEKKDVDQLESTQFEIATTSGAWIITEPEPLGEEHVDGATAMVKEEPVNLLMMQAALNISNDSDCILTLAYYEELRDCDDANPN